MKRGLGKRGQFFILSAVIIASIIVSLASIQNFVTSEKSSEKIYYYGQQLEYETGAVIDYNLYKGSGSRLNDFLQDAISSILNNYPDLDVYACYSSSLGILSCQNNGSSDITVTAAGSTYILKGYKTNPGLESVKKDINIVGVSTLTINANGNSHSIPLLNSAVVPEQFYFILRVNYSSGEFVDASGDVRRV